MSRRRFEEAVMPHLNAAFNYARWLTRSEADAEDVVQEACVRAMRFLSSLRDGDARPWLLAIVRNTWYSHVSRTKPGVTVPFDDRSDERHDAAPDPEQRLLRLDDVARIDRAQLQQLVRVLQAPLGEVRVAPLDRQRRLRRVDRAHGIAHVAGIPIGTVMSRIARGRERLLAALGTEVTR